MNAVILVAGRSSRLRPLTDALPKCLLEVGDVAILRRAIDHLEALGIERLVIVTGFLEELIREKVREWRPGLRVEFVVNEQWETTNNCFSLLLAAEALAGEGFLLIDGDVVFDRAVIAEVVRAPHDNVFVLRRASDLGDEEMKVDLDPTGLVRVISKEIPPADAAGESVGIFRFSSGAKAITACLRERTRGRGLYDEWYESAFQQAIDEGMPLYAVEAAGYVSEIDTAGDLARVDRYVRGAR